MSEKTLQTNIDALQEFVRSKGWSIIAEKEIAHGYQLVVTDGINKTPVDLFTTGKMLIQGRPGALQAEIQLWANERRATSLSLPMLDEPAPCRIGSDESGKGDYFGPLVIGSSQTTLQDNQNNFANLEEEQLYSDTALRFLQKQQTYQLK